MNLTTIVISANDQDLAITQKPLLASGDIDSVLLHVDFDSVWDGYAKTAIFYQNANNAYHALLDSNNECLIPWEVMTKEGTMYFGIYGVKDGIQKTTEVLKYNIKQGAWIPSSSPSEPSEDIYKQLLSAYATYSQKAEAIYTNMSRKLWMTASTVTLPHANWVNGLQTVAVADVTEDTEACHILATYAPESYEEYKDCDVRVSGQGNGTLTFSCSKSFVPVHDLYVNIMVCKTADTLAYSEGGSGGGTGADVVPMKAFYVTITGSDGNYTSDKTLAEITEAYESGNPVFARADAFEGLHLVFTLAGFTDDCAVFVSFADSMYMALVSSEWVRFDTVSIGNTNGSGSCEGGHNLVKGVDYWTEADKAEIIQDVITALGTPVFGTVDEDNNIILTGNLAAGTYTLKYEDADGSVTEIGTFNSSGASGGDSAYTNQIPISTDTDGSIYNGTGYKEKSRGNSSGGVADLDNPDCEIPPFVTGFIPATIGSVVRLKNCYIDAKYASTESSASKYGNGTWGLRMGLYDASKTKVSVVSWGDLYDGKTDVFSNWTKDSNGYITEFTIAQNGVSFIRLCLAATGSPSDAIVTVNQEII